MVLVVIGINVCIMYDDFWVRVEMRSIDHRIEAHKGWESSIVPVEGMRVPYRVSIRYAGLHSLSRWKRVV